MPIICNTWIEDKVFQNQNTYTHRLVVTGVSIPKEIKLVVVIERRVIATSNEEADNIIGQQVSMCAMQPTGTTVALSDDRRISSSSISL